MRCVGSEPTRIDHHMILRFLRSGDATSNPTDRNWWALRVLAKSVPQNRLFAVYDGDSLHLSTRLARSLHGNETLPLPRRHLLACPWKSEAAKLSSALEPAVRRASGYHARIYGPSHVLYEPRLECWRARFGHLFQHVWHVEKDTMLHDHAAGDFFNRFAADTSDLIGYSFAWVHNDSWLYAIGDAPSTLRLSQVMRQSGIAGDLDVQASPTRGGLLWHSIIVRRLSLRLLRLLVMQMRQMHFRHSEVFASSVCARTHGCTLSSWNPGPRDRMKRRWATPRCFDYRIGGDNRFRDAVFNDSKIIFGSISLCAEVREQQICSGQWIHPVLELRKRHTVPAYSCLKPPHLLPLGTETQAEVEAYTAWRSKWRKLDPRLQTQPGSRPWPARTRARAAVHASRAHGHSK